ncbi:hypothetical protein HanRHA438_Chr09g0400371 [Helianthus annuus]|nr:hypothetical protein HanRHA438_Chr09g0400371 [Helianthus annuus]
MDGSELNIGRRMGSRRRNLAYNGSLLNSAFFRYTSPIDLDICKHNPKQMGVHLKTNNTFRNA